MRRYNLVSLGGDALCACGHRRTMHLHGRCDVVGCQCGADARLTAIIERARRGNPLTCASLSILACVRRADE